MSFLMFYFSYLFSVMLLGLVVMVLMMLYMSGMLFVKYLITLVYISGVVVFMLYISCMCWNVGNMYSKWFLVFGISLIWLFDSGCFAKFSDMGESLWLYLFFSFIFNTLIMGYSLNLFKIAGSLRF